MVTLEINRPFISSVFPGFEDFFTQFKDDKDSKGLILTHIYLLIGCLLPFEVSRIYSKTYEFETLLSPHLTSHRNKFSKMKLKFQILTFNLVPETKFVEIESFNSLFASGFGKIGRFFQNQSYISTFKIMSRQKQSNNTWNNMIKYILTRGQTNQDFEFIDQNKILIIQSMLIVKLIKFSGIISLCLGDTMVNINPKPQFNLKRPLL